MAEMTDEMKAAKAQEIYKKLCTAIENRNWHYNKDEENLVAYFGVTGEDIPMQFIIMVDAARQLVRLMSPMSFKMSEAKRMEGAIATCVATFGLADGSFDYDMSEGRIAFRMTASYRESNFGDGLFQYMISCSCATVDEYNDKFLALDKGIMSLDDFIKNC